MATSTDYYHYANGVWGTWSSEYHSTTSASVCTSTQANIWTEWAGTSGTVTCDYEVVQNTVWINWSNDYQYDCSETSYNPKVAYFKQYNTKSKEQLRAEKTQRAIDAAWKEKLIKEQAEEKRIAEETAVVLLGELVSREELEHYIAHGEIVVKGKERDYLVRKNRGVIRLEKDKVTSLCIHLRDKYQYPETDNVIAMKLLIEGNETEFNKIANVSSLNKKDQDSYRSKVEDIVSSYRIRRVA